MDGTNRLDSEVDHVLFDARCGNSTSSIACMSIDGLLSSLPGLVEGLESLPGALVVVFIFL